MPTEDIILRILADASQARQDVGRLRRDFLAAIDDMEVAARRPDFDPASAEARELGAEVQRTGIAFQQAFDRAQREAKQTAGAMDILGDETSDTANAVRRLDQEFDKLRQSGAGVQGITSALTKMRNVLGSIGVYLGGRELIQFAADAVRTKADVDSMEASLRAAGETAERDAELTRFLAEETARLGFNYIGTGRSLANYEVALRGSNLSEERRLDLFRQLLEVLRARNLGEQDATLVLRALGQIASKGAVSMEELRQQIGERLPGALEAAAVKLGVTRQELEKLISTGQLSAAEGLPAIIEGLRDAVTDEDLADGLDQTNKKLADMANLAIQLKTAFAQGFAGELTKGFDAATESADGLTTATSGVGRAVGYVGKLLRENATAFGDLFQAQDIAFDSFKAGQIDLEGMSGALEEHWGWVNIVVKALLALDRVLVPERYRDALQELTEATDDLADAAQRAQALELLSDWISRLQDEGGLSGEVLAGVAASVEMLVGAYEAAGDKVPPVLESMRQRLADLIDPATDAGDAVAEVGEKALTAAEQVEQALKRWEQAVASARDELKAKAEEASQEVRLLLAVIGDLGDATQEQLEEAGDALEDAREAWALYGEDLPADLAAADEALRGHLRLVDELGPKAEAAADKVRDLVAQVGDLGTANEVQLEAVRDAVQGALDAYELAGDEIPDDLQAIADALGVVSTAQKKLADEAEKELKRVQKAAEKVVEAIAAAYKQIRPDEADLGGDLLERQAKLLAERDALSGKPLLDLKETVRLQEIDAELREVRASLADLDKGAGEASASVEDVADAIRKLLGAAGPGLSQLSEAQRAAIATTLQNLQSLASVGKASSAVVQSSFRRIAEELQRAGIDTSALQAALADTGGAIGNVAALFEQAAAQAQDSIRSQVEGYDKLDERQREEVDQLDTLNKFRKKVHEEEIKRLDELAKVHEEKGAEIVKVWDQLIAKCEEFRRCLQQTADAV